MGGDGRDDDSARRISSHDCNMDYGNISKEGQRRGAGMGLGGSGIGDHGYLDDKGVREEVAGKKYVVCNRETDIQDLYRRREDGGLQYVPKVVGPRTRTQKDRE